MSIFYAVHLFYCLGRLFILVLLVLLGALAAALVDLVQVDADTAVVLMQVAVDTVGYC